MNISYLGIVNPEFPYVTGLLIPKSLAAYTFNIMTPDITTLDGNINMVNGDKFIAPENGVYRFCFSGAKLSVVHTAETQTFVVYNSESVGSNFKNVAVNLGKFGLVSSVSVELTLETEDFLTLHVFTDIATHGINYAEMIPVFAFGRIF